ncbi:MAG TPA: hypothetical protein VF593_03745 [Chthoniobacteraceae bacterium]
MQSAVPNSFGEVTAQLDPGGDFYLYLNTQQWLAGLSQEIGDLRGGLLAALGQPADPAAAGAGQAVDAIARLIQRSGLEDVTGVGMSSIALRPDFFRNRFFVHHASGKGDGFLLQLGGKTPHPLHGLDLLPTDTAMSFFSDADLALLFRVISEEIGKSGVPELQKGFQQTMSQFAQLAGAEPKDLFDSLGGEVGMILTLDPQKQIQIPDQPSVGSIPEPSLAIFLKVKNDRIFTLAERMFASHPQLAKVDEPEFKMRSIPLPLGPGINLRPTLAQWGEWLVIASSDEFFRRIVETKKAGGGFKTTADFAALSADLPTQGNAFGLATPRFGELVAKVQNQLMQANGSTPSAQLALFQKLNEMQKPGAYFTVRTHLENGILSVSNSSQGVTQMLAPVVAVPAILAGMAVPVFGEVSKRGELTTSLSNAKQIGLACILYSHDYNGKMPPNLEALIPDYLPSANVFVSPLSPDEPMGYSYVAGLDTASTPPSTIIIEDKFARQKGKRVVVRMDGSGEVLPVN